MLRPQIFTSAREWPSITSAPPTGNGSPPYNFFFKGGSKIGLKCNKCNKLALITSELGGVARRNFGTWRGSRLGVNASTNFEGTAPLKIREGKKRSKIGAIYDNFRVWVQISLEPMTITTESKRRWQEQSFRRWTKKICEIPSTTNQVISANVDLPVKLRYFLLGSWPRCVYDTCRKIVLSIYFTCLNKLATYISRRVCYIFWSI